MENLGWYQDADIYELHVKAFFDSGNTFGSTRNEI